MNVNYITVRRLLAYTIGLSSLTACGWVDSTGTQGVNFTGNGELRNAHPISLTEDTSVSAKLVGEGSSLHNWTWTPGFIDERARCDELDGFDADISRTTLESACSNADSCEVSISEITSNGATAFQIKMPKLNAPVALSYSVSTVRDDGAIVTRQQPLCGLSINEAPEPQDDEYIVRRSAVRIVDANDPDNLLSNDHDDSDIRNFELRVLTTPVKAPEFAKQFSLNANGGFTYEVSPDAPIGESGVTEDSFSYAITDGLHTVQANVVLTIVEQNEAPEQFQQIPDVVLTAYNGSDDSHLRRIDISQFFWDPDNDSLSFESAEIDANEGLSLESNGYLISSATEQDVGQWRATVIASDGIEKVSGEFVITVRMPVNYKNIDENTQPTVTDIRNRTFNGTFKYDVTEFFTEADIDDQLTYTAVGLPAGIQIRADGVIEGSVTAANTGRWFVRVTAEDGYGGLVTDGFLLILN